MGAHLKPQTAQRPGLAARTLALRVVRSVAERRLTIEEAMERTGRTLVDPRDRALARALAAAVFRRRGEIDAVLARFLDRPLPLSAGIVFDILRLGAAQLLFFRTPPHAAIDLCVDLARGDPKARHFSGLVNAVLRNISRKGASLLDGLDAGRLNTPQWLWVRWCRQYGEASAARIAAAHLAGAALDLTPLGEPERWAAELAGMGLPGGTIRLIDPEQPVEDLPGYDEGAWWVQDAAAAWPARLFGDLRGRKVLDLCAAPGGKTAQLISQGAQVLAVDGSASRCRRMSENLGRLRLKAEVIQADILAFEPPGCFDAVLLDAPCSATGTIRRHPELPYLKTEDHVLSLAARQRMLIERAAGWIKPGGLLVYTTCSLEAEEGEEQARWLPGIRAGLRLDPIRPAELAACRHLLTEEGFLRTLPFMTIGEAVGMDGFFAARFRRN